MKGETPKRILMTADTVGGVWTYALELIRALEPSGVRFGLATMGASPNETQREELAAMGNVQLFESRFKLEWMDDPWGDVEQAGEWLLEIEREFEPDVVHLNGYAHGSLPWTAPVLVVAHSCVLSWWKAVKKEPLPTKYDAYRNAVKKGIAAAQAVIAPTRAMLGSVFEHYGEPRVAGVIPNGRNLDRFQPGPKDHFILSAGRLWDEAKNVRAVCACSLNLGWPVCLAGETQHPDGGCAEFANVRCLGKLSPETMANWFGRAAIFAHPAKYEPFGLSVLEAALSGCALVLGDIPSLRENWEDAAIFVNPGNHSELERALQQLISDKALREQLGAAAWHRGLSFGLERSAADYLAAYTSSISSNALLPL